jgi:hypothetical protein
MRVTFKAIVLRHRRRKDNTFPVNIRIGSKSKYSFLQINLFVSKNDLSKSLEIKNFTINERYNRLV